MAVAKFMDPFKRFYFNFFFFVGKGKKKTAAWGKTPWWKNEGEFLACPSPMNSVAHPLLQKQWSTSASQPLEKLILAANSQFHAAKSFFQSKRWNFLYSQWQHGSWLPCKWEWILGIRFFFFVNHDFLIRYFFLYRHINPVDESRFFFLPPPRFFVLFYLVWFSLEAQ